MERKIKHLRCNEYQYYVYNGTIDRDEMINIHPSEIDPLSIDSKTITDESPKWMIYNNTNYIKLEKIPSSNILDYGEFAINYKNNFEKVFIKNDKNIIVPFERIQRIHEPIKINTSLFNNFKNGEYIKIDTDIESIVKRILTNGVFYTEADANKVLSVNNDGTSLVFKKLEETGGGGSGDLTNYYTKQETEKYFIKYKDASLGRVKDANQWLEQGFALTDGVNTKNLPPQCKVTYKDKWGVLLFVPENLPNGTGTQIFFPVDGTYKGRLFTRSLTNMKRSEWNPTASDWYLVAFETNPTPAQEPQASPQVMSTPTKQTKIKMISTQIEQAQNNNVELNNENFKNDSLILPDASNYESCMSFLCDYFIDLQPMKKINLSIAQPLLINNVNENVDKSYPSTKIIEYILTGFNGGYYKDKSIENEFEFFINLNVITKSDRVIFNISDNMIIDNINNTNLNKVGESLKLEIKQTTNKRIFYNSNFSGNEINNPLYMDYINKNKSFIPVQIHVFGKNWGKINENKKDRFISIYLK